MSPLSFHLTHKTLQVLLVMQCYKDSNARVLLSFKAGVNYLTTGPVLLLFSISDIIQCSIKDWFYFQIATVLIKLSLVVLK